jgi:hypothetical protein
VLAAGGLFRVDGVFVALPAIPLEPLEQGLRSEVLKRLVTEHAIGERLSASMLAWRHSGFSVHNGLRVARLRNHRRDGTSGEQGQDEKRRRQSLGKIRHHAD